MRDMSVRGSLPRDTSLCPKHLQQLGECGSDVVGDTADRFGAVATWSAPQEAAARPAEPPETSQGARDALAAVEPNVIRAANEAPVSAPPGRPRAEDLPHTPSGEPTVAPLLPYDIMLGVTGNSPQYGLLGDVSGRLMSPHCDRPEPNAHYQPFRCPGRREELYVGDDRRDGLAAHPKYQRAAAAARDGHLPLQPGDGLPTGVHVDGRAEQRRRPGQGVHRRLR